MKRTISYALLSLALCNLTGCDWFKSLFSKSEKAAGAKADTKGDEENPGDQRVADAVQDAATAVKPKNKDAKAGGMGVGSAAPAAAATPSEEGGAGTSGK